MAKKIKKPEKEKRISIELKGIPLIGGLFRGIEKFLKLAEEAEKAGGKIETEGEFKGVGKNKGITGVYKFSIRTGIGMREKPKKQIKGSLKKEVKENGEN